MASSSYDNPTPRHHRDRASAPAETDRPGLGSLDLDEPLRDVAQLASQTIPGNHGIGVTLFDEDGQPIYRSSNGFAMAVDRCQYSLRQGPCVDAAEQGRTIITGSVGVGEGRWPQFIRDAKPTQVRSVLSVPLTVTDRIIGTINVYSRTLNAFGPEAITAAENFAEPAAAALSTTQLFLTTLDIAEVASNALAERGRVEAAVGVLMAQHNLTAAGARRRLAELAEKTGQTLSGTAGQVLADATRSIQP